MDLNAQNLWIILAVVAAILVLAFLFLRPRQRVPLTDSAPTRPHMQAPRSEREGRGLAGEAAAAASDVTGDIFSAPVHSKLGGSSEPADDLLLLKGIGEMFLAALQIAGPLVVVLFLTDVAFGLLNRVAPALNAFQLGFPAKIFLVLVLSGIAITTLPQVIETLVDRSVTAVLKLTGG